MTGEQNLTALIKSMTPELQDGVFVFCQVQEDKPLTGLDPILTFKEKEGRSLILRQEEAKAAGIDSIYPCRMITLSIHSSLEAIGFLAAITKKLAEADISVNAVSAFYHDHLFVPEAKAALAMELLYELAETL